MLSKQDLDAIATLLRPLEKKVNKFHKEFNTWVKHFDTHLQQTRKDVDKIKDHIRLPKVS